MFKGELVRSWNALPPLLSLTAPPHSLLILLNGFFGEHKLYSVVPGWPPRFSLLGERLGLFLIDVANILYFVGENTTVSAVLFCYEFTNILKKFKLKLKKL